LISAAINSEYVSLAIIIVLNSAIAVYYYMKLVIYMFLKDPDPVMSDAGLYATNASTPLKVIVGVAAIITMFAIVFVEPLLTIITKYVTASGF